MRNDKPKPILVTGSHRSGTTWVGRMLALPDSVVYIHEPFNLHQNENWFKTGFENWLTYVTCHNEHLYYNDIRKIVGFRYGLKQVLKACGRGANFGLTLKRYKRLLYHRWNGHIPLLKDPIAVLSAEWLYRRFDANVVVMIRHPAAFAGSLKKQDWTHPFTHFLRQPRLMEDHLEPFYEKIVQYAEYPPDIIDQASLLWCIIYSVVKKYRERHDDWLFLRHEDISRNPIEEFHKLYDALELEFTPKVQEIIQVHSNISNKSEYQKSSHTLKRYSESNIWNWKRRLTCSEIRRIREQVEDISKDFYTDEDWHR